MSNPEKNGHTERVDHRSYQRQGIDQIPTIHLGAAASQMEQADIYFKHKGKKKLSEAD